MYENKAFTMMTLLMIFMAILFTSIIMFGFMKLNDVKNSLSDTQLNQVKSDIMQIVNYCSDPLNAGAERILKVSESSVGGLCILPDTITSSDPGFVQSQTVKTIKDSGDNVVIAGSGSSEDQASDILGSFRISYYKSIDKSMCWFRDGGNELVIDITC